MDPYIDFMNEVNSVVIESVTAKEIIDKIDSSEILDLGNDFGIIYSTINILKYEFSDEFLQEVINNGKIDLIKNNIANVGVRNIFTFALESNNEELTEFIGKNFKQLINMGFENGYIDIDIIKPFILNEEFSKEVKECMPILIRNMFPGDRIELIDIINNADNKLGYIQDYLSDFLYFADNKKVIGADDILVALQDTKDLDKTILLEEINNNIENLINTFYGSLHYKMIDFLSIIKEIEEEIPKESQEIVKKVNKSISNNCENILEKYEYNIALVELLREFNIDNKKFKDIQDNIIAGLSGADLLKYIELAKENEGFDKDWDSLRLTRELFKEGKEVQYDETAQITIAKLIEELCEHENIGIEDIEYAGAGAFSFGIKIGNYVLKLGEDVFVEDRQNIPTDKRILKPLIRQQNNQEDQKRVANIFMEVQNLVDNKWYENLSPDEIKEQLYMIYSELRDRNIRWTDVKPENVGKLLKPNKENFEIETLNGNGQVEKVEMKSDNYAIGFRGEEPNEILRPGELVIIDTDYIYDEDDNYETPVASYYKAFEKRYQKEKQAKLENNITVQGIKQIIKDEGYTKENLGIIEKELQRARDKGGRGKEE